MILPSWLSGGLLAAFLLAPARLLEGSSLRSLELRPRSLRPQAEIDMEMAGSINLGVLKKGFRAPLYV